MQPVAAWRASAIRSRSSSQSASAVTARDPHWPPTTPDSAPVESNHTPSAGNAMTVLSNDAVHIETSHSTGSSIALPPPIAARGRVGITDNAGKILKAAATSWFVVAVVGQLLFVAYVIGFYGRAAIHGQFENWNKVLPHGYVAGDTVGNLILGMHLLFAAVIILGGALQLLPGLRRRWPVFHRWNGRVYLTSALVLSVGGLLMLATRETVGGLSQKIAISINASLIIGFAVMALYHARARRIDLHRRWALRLFLAVSGVWFFRIGLMFWIVANQGPVGFDPKTFQGPFLTFLAFAQYLLPLAVMQLYFYVQDNAGSRGRIAMAAGLGVLTLITATGIFAASMIMWLPRLS
jgi:hypothetical protein